MGSVAPKLLVAVWSLPSSAHRVNGDVMLNLNCIPLAASGEVRAAVIPETIESHLALLVVLVCWSPRTGTLISIHWLCPAWPCQSPG